MKSINSQSLKESANEFLLKVFKNLEKINIALEEHWHIDHLCYRTATQESYLSVRRQMEQFSTLLIESEVNGRLISTFKLTEPIIFHDWEIDLIEVPAPKAGKNFSDGFEHFELVCDLDFKELQDRYPQCQWDESGLAKIFNRELELLLNGCAIKFHHSSLESVINIEKNQRVFSALNELKILDHLKNFHPLIAGTFPLNLNLEGSDIDILIATNDFNIVKELLHKRFSKDPTFTCEEITVMGEPTLLVCFSHHDVDLEVFVQKTPPIKQRGYLHFLIEERLLKMGREPLAEKVRHLREQGLKTEPAFAKALELHGDPYEELLLLQKKSNKALKKLLIGN